MEDSAGGPGKLSLGLKYNRGCWHLFDRPWRHCPDLTFINIAGFSIAGVIVCNHFSMD